MRQVSRPSDPKPATFCPREAQRPLFRSDLRVRRGGDIVERVGFPVRWIVVAIPLVALALRVGLY
jgi:hypothetical protein